MKKLFLLMSLLVFLNGCSDNEADDIELSFTPERPRVRTSPGKFFVYTDSEGNGVFEDITPPWFEVSLSLNNGTTKNIVVDKITMKASGMSLNGEGYVTAEASLDSTSLSNNKDEVDSNDTSVLFSYAPGQVTTPPTTVPIKTYFGSLPTGVPVFSVEVTVEGWFGTENAPEDAFTQKYYFTTD